MQKIMLLVALAIMAGACNQTAQNKAETKTDDTASIVAATIEDLVASPAEYQDKEVAIQGMVTHVCRHGGQKCFVLS